MKQIVFVAKLIFALLIIFTCSELSRAQSSSEIQTKGKVCPNPSAPCVKKAPNVARVFEDADLSFKLPAKLTWQRNYYSASFYAIVLKSKPAVEDKSPAEKSTCAEGYFSDAEREEIQAMFPARKVFASRKGCYNYATAYTNTENGYEFVAVYAGNTKAEAQKFLKQIKAKKEFPDAIVRKMQVVYGYGD